jgi:hypothetical protein
MCCASNPSSVARRRLSRPLKKAALAQDSSVSRAAWSVSIEVARALEAPRAFAFRSSLVEVALVASKCLRVVALLRTRTFRCVGDTKALWACQGRREAWDRGRTGPVGGPVHDANRRRSGAFLRWRADGCLSDGGRIISGGDQVLPVWSPPTRRPRGTALRSGGEGRCSARTVAHGRVPTVARRWEGPGGASIGRCFGRPSPARPISSSPRSGRRSRRRSRPGGASR